MKPSFLYRSPSCASIPSPGARGLRGLPATWRKVGSWTIKHNFVSVSDTVSFYALALSEEQPLARELVRYGGRLPRAVQQSGAYMAIVRGGTK